MTKLGTAVSTRGVLYGVGVAVTVLLSLCCSGVGWVLITAGSEWCSSGSVCQTEAYFAGAVSYATVVVPVAFAIWGRWARTAGGVAARLAICMAGYLVPLTWWVDGWISASTGG